MSSTTFPNGLTLTSTALTAEGIEDIFQLAIMQCLGLNPGTVTQGTLTQGSNQIVVADAGTIAVGQSINGRGIPPGATVESIGISGGFGGGGFGDEPFDAPAVITITMTKQASFPNTFGTGGFGDMPFDDPSTWNTMVSFGADANAYYKVRVGWQPNGQPGWQRRDDVVSVMAIVYDDQYNRIRDVMNAPNDATTVLETTRYTRCWEMKFSVYGPHSADNARLIKSCLRLQWFRDIVSASNLYLVPNDADPVRAPENFNKQWWDRSDFRARYYEAVQETITQQTVATAEVVLEAAIGGYGTDGYGIDPYGVPVVTTVDISV